MSQSHLLTFTESEAFPHITKCLDYFFYDDGRNKYTYSSAYLKYTKLQDEALLCPKRLFNIVRNTNLIVNENIFRHQTTHGFNYFINKQFYQLAERRHCRIKRRKNIPPSGSETNSTNSRRTQESTKVTPDTSSEPKKYSYLGSLSIGETWNNTNPTSNPSTHDSVPASIEPVPTQQNTTDNTPIGSTPPEQHNKKSLEGEIQNFITSEISLQINEYFSKNPPSSAIEKYFTENPPQYTSINAVEVNVIQESIAKFDEEYCQGVEKLRARMTWVNDNMSSSEKKFNQKFDEGIDTL